MKNGDDGLRILYVVSIMPPYPGGAAVDYASFVKGFGSGRFSDRVRSVTVLTEKGCSRDYGASVVRIKDTLFNYDTAGKKSFFAQLANYFTILAHILFGGYDIVHIHARYVYAGYIGRLIWLALVLSRAGAVVDIRDRFYRNFGFGPSFIVCSEALRSHYSWIRGAVSIPVPLSLPTLEGKKETGENLAYFGTIAANKGVMELLEGFELYSRDRGGDEELHLYGSNSMGAKFLKAIEGKKRIRYFGPIANEEVFPKIAGYRAVVLPSMSEGMPRICLETIYCERVIVCHRNIKSIIPCIPEDFILNDLTPGEFKRVFEQVERVKGPVAYGYDFAAHRPQSVCDRLVEHYSRITAGRRARSGKAGELIKRRS